MQLDRMTCEEAFARIDAFVDRELNEAEQRLVAAHLEVCEVCAVEFAYEASVLATVRAKIARVQAPAGLRERLAQALRAPDDD